MMRKLIHDATAVADTPLRWEARDLLWWLALLPVWAASMAYIVYLFISHLS